MVFNIIGILSSLEGNKRGRVLRYYIISYLLKMEKFDYAYAITTHLSQGAQFPYGIYIEEYMGDISQNLNYVGITRFSQRMIYVKHKPKLYI